MNTAKVLIAMGDATRYEQTERGIVLIIEEGLVSLLRKELPDTGQEFSTSNYGVRYDIDGNNLREVKARTNTYFRGVESHLIERGQYEKFLAVARDYLTSKRK